jgi:hypothetical protein
MHTRRVATFLLGMWLGCSVFMGWIAMENSRFHTGVGSLAAADQNRLYFRTWEEVQIGLGVALAVCLFLGTQKLVAPLICCALLLLLVLFEHFGLMPGLTNSIYADVEGAKLILGGFLASYLFVFRTKQRVREAVSTRPGPSALHR